MDRKFAGVVLSLVLFWTSHARAQGEHPDPAPTPGTAGIDGRTSTSGNLDEAARLSQHKRLVAADRSKRIARDSAKLLRLAGELKSEVDGSAQIDPPADIVRKLEDMEKLAHNIVTRTRDS